MYSEFAVSDLISAVNSAIAVPNNPFERAMYFMNLKWALEEFAVLCSKEYNDLIELLMNEPSNEYCVVMTYQPKAVINLERLRKLCPNVYSQIAFVKSESYKAPVVFFDANGDEKGQVYVTAPTSTVYTDATALLVADANLGEAIAGMGGEQSLDETDALWNAKISFELNGDTFSVNFNREYAVVSGYSEDATLAVLETWFDNNASVA